MFRSLTILAAMVLATAESRAGQPFCELGRPLYQFFSTREYGGDNQNWSAVQNPEGLVFFGNNNSVLDYDGQRWDHIAVAGGFAIRGLAIDSTGEIWVGGSGKLGHLIPDGDRYRFVPVKADPPSHLRWARFWTLCPVETPNLSARKRLFWSIATVLGMPSPGLMAMASTTSFRPLRKEYSSKAKTTRFTRLSIGGWFHSRMILGFERQSSIR